MIKALSDQRSKSLAARLSHPMERIDIFPELGEYCKLIKEISLFIEAAGRVSEFGIEKYKGDFQFFSADDKEPLAIMFVTKFSPQELIFFGEDWLIGMSSYPEFEGSASLEYSIRLYGEARIIKMSDVT